MLNKIKSYFKANAWARYAAVAFIGLVIGMAAGSPAPETITKTETKTVEKRVEVAPQSCKDAINLDNQIFIKVGDGLGKMDFNGVVTYLEGVTPERTRLITDCVSK